jgi:hypothetical protein
MAGTTLAQYIKETRRVLSDASARYWTDIDLMDYINEARMRTVVDTGCNRQLQTAYLNSSTETFVFGGVTGVNITAGGSGFANGTYALVFTGGDGAGAAGKYTCNNGAVVSATITAQGAGYTVAPTPTFPSGGGTSAAGVTGIISDKTVDILNATIIWGAQRIPLNYMAFTKLNAYMRAVQIVSSMPQVFTMYGQNTLYIQPVPDQIYPIELDTVVTLPDLAAMSDIDTIRTPYTLGIPFYAASMAKYNSQRADEAAALMADYEKRIRVAIRASVTRRLPSAYGR